MAKMITAIIVKGTEPINSVVLSEDNAKDWFDNYDGTTVILDPEDDFRSEFVTVKGCKAVDVTNLDPMPGVGSGWKYDKGAWIPPIVSETVDE